MNTKTLMKMIIMVAILSVVFLVPTAYAQSSTILIEYLFEEIGTRTVLETDVDLEINCAELVSMKDPNVSSWEYSHIEGTYEDENGQTQTASYEAAFAGWKLVAINGVNVTGDYTYPAADLVYFDDAPFLTYNGNIMTLKFKALWGKTIYIRDKYNFTDIKNVYGYKVTGTNGDINKGKIAWDTSVEYASQYNSGASSTEPIDSFMQAVNMLSNSHGGKIVIVNHFTFAADEKYYPYSSSYVTSNQSQTFSIRI